MKRCSAFNLSWAGSVAVFHFTPRPSLFCISLIRTPTPETLIYYPKLKDPKPSLVISKIENLKQSLNHKPKIKNPKTKGP